MSLALAVALAAAALLPLSAELAAAGEEAGPSVMQGDRWRNALWAVGIFLVLLVILGRLAWKPVLRAVQERERAISDTIADAERRQAESAELLAEYRARLEAAEKEAAGLMAQSAQQAAAAREEIISQAKDAAAVETTKAQTEIERAKRESLDEIYRTTTELAANVAERILLREIRPEDHADLLQRSLKKLKEKR